MLPRIPRAALFALAVGLIDAPQLALAATPVPPPTRVATVIDTLHGIPVEDPYRWLEDKNSPETRDWVKAQMAFTVAQLGKVAGREQVVAALAKYSKVDTRSVPQLHGKRAFFTMRRADQQQPVLAMREPGSNTDIVLVDPNNMSPDHTTSVSFSSFSADGKFMMYGVRKGGEDEVELHLYDVDKRAEVADGGLPKARYFGVAFDKAKTGFWYSRWAPEGSRVRFHKLGTDAAKDPIVFGDGLGPTEIPGAALSDNGRWLLIRVSVGSSGDNTRYYIKNVEKNGPIVTIADTLRSSIAIDMAGDQMVVLTNWSAPNRRIMLADAAKPQPQFWKPIVPESPDAVIENVSLVGGRIYAAVLKDVSSRLRVYGLDGVAGGEVPLPGIGSTGGMNGEWDGKEGFFQFASFHMPPVIFRYDVTSGNASTWWKSPAPFATDAFEVRQFSIRSTNGAKVPFFVVARKGTPFDGSNKVLMGGYGGFNVNVTPSFNPFIAAWLDLGGMYVSTNLRGGAEFGEAWHRDGMLANKQHTFDDFLNITQWLLMRGYCLRQGLAINGGSNGGLLVGAAMTQRPDLYGAVLCQVPLLDMMRYHQFLVARFWVPEYGSSEDPDQFNWLRSYSPYQNLKPNVKYPSVMFVTGDSDTRVDPLHARKMAARMQALGGENPVLLHYDVSSGHAGGKSVDKSIEDNADLLQFLRWRLGMARQPTP
ncbi:MAG: prolyl oligopeptidase family serine peptidase [Candidatus Eisenbacteria bacterium]